MRRVTLIAENPVLPPPVAPATSGPTVHVKTFGCQMNAYDSKRMLSLLEEKGYCSVPDVREAEVVLVNTCAIRDKSEHKVLSLLGQLKPWKEKNSGRVLGLAGCVAQRIGRQLLQRVPHLDFVIGPDVIDQVHSVVESARKHGKRTIQTKFDEAGRSYSQPAVVHRAKPSEFMTIMKGCDHFCTYCIVPFVRGREKSRSIEEILCDTKAYVDRGTKEIVFLGQNINTYGKGTSENLAELIERADRIEGLERIRYVTSHPRDLGQDLIDQFGTIEKLCPALHLPVQSGSDRVLKRMSRLYTRDQYLDKIDRLRKACPDIAMSSDVIVGFPGETDEDFRQTLDLVRTVGFSVAFLFKYSPRPGTRAMAYQGEEIPESLKEERLAELQSVVNPKIEIENATYVGKTTPVLVESMDKKGLCYTGRNPQGKLVHIYDAGPACIGKMIDVRITESTGSNLRGVYRFASSVVPAKHIEVPVFPA